MREVRASNYRSRDLIEALLAVLGIWLVVRYVPDYAATLWMLSYASSNWTAEISGHAHFVQVLHFAVSLLLGATLVMARKPAARWLNPKSHSSNDAYPGPLVAVGVATVGVLYIAEGITALGSHYLVQPSRDVQSFNSAVIQGWVSVVIGASLFVTSVGISRLWLLLRGRADFTSI